MPEYRSRTTTHGKNMAGARGLWRATGMTDDDFGKPIIAIANSFTQFVPGHVHLKDLGQMVAREIERAGGVAKEFNTIAVDDGYLFTITDTVANGSGEARELFPYGLISRGGLPKRWRKVSPRVGRFGL